MTNLPFSNEIYKIVLSSPAKNSEGYVRGEIVSNGEIFQVSLFTQKQVFHKNINPSEVEGFVLEQLGTNFMQYTAWGETKEYSAKITKKGKLLASVKQTKNPPRKQTFAGAGFNIQKNYIIKEGDNIPVLVDMGIFTKENKIAASMHHKFRQINRFVELLADEAKDVNIPVNIVDFGCGKSYLTFLTYHYFANVCKVPVNICGLDLNETVINSCKKAAEKYSYTTLTFKVGDIATQAAPPLSSWGTKGSFNIVISLHACDTATDHALFNAIKWNADLILAAPCCQHELNKQMQPKTLGILSEYGLIQERFAALATDVIRAKLLESVGYRAQILEFIETEHTPKNILIRARKGKPNPAMLQQVAAMIEEFSFSPTLLQLLSGLE